MHMPSFSMGAYANKLWASSFQCTFGIALLIEARRGCRCPAGGVRPKDGGNRNLTFNRKKGSSPMKLSAKLGIATIAVITSIAGVALAQENIPSSSLPADKVQFGPTGLKTEVGELKAGPAYGDLGKGRHGTFIRMPAKFVSPLHGHTADYFGIVIQGVVINTQPGNADVPLPVGSYWFQKGKENHVTKCISDRDCLFFIYQPDKFDYVPAK
jgi:beta-alanine degradation protein BauB